MCVLTQILRVAKQGHLPIESFPNALCKLVFAHTSGPCLRGCIADSMRHHMAGDGENISDQVSLASTADPDSSESIVPPHR